MLPQGKVSAAGAKRQKRSEGPCGALELNPPSMATASGPSAQAASAAGQQHRSAGRFPQGTFFFRAHVASPEESEHGKHAEQGVALVFSPGFPSEFDLLLPPQVLQKAGLRPKPPPDEAGPSTSSAGFVEYGPLDCSVQLQLAGSESIVTGRLDAAAPPSSGLPDPPPSTSYVPPESIVARVRSRRKKNRGLVELVDYQEAGPDEKLECGFIGPRGLLAWGLGFDATGLCLFPLSQGGRNLVSGLT
ncbi:hypothetical protein KFL_000920310 [Klebsormidium nitens]|uniref:Uncharacterized protein n=1 Tax=Klebsormidium nitens TaxID=105231 RepID=A0A0U9HSF0_KLENI|nr:hypothetical protein KFL_000920310 [Klebsormidium nitens]|eukprot:GAQ81847.1 hypothetical protein KFL_000920310 [Klebsormidium nitens]